MLYVGSQKYKLYVGSERRMIVAPEPLPYDAEVEYLESTGTQWIDTGVSCNADNIVEVEFNSPLKTEAIFGARTSTGNKEHSLVMASEGDVSYRSRNTQTQLSVSYNGYTASTWVNMKCSKDNLYADGVLVAQVSNWVTFSNARHYYLFGMNTNGTASNLGAKKIRAFKISNNGQLLLDMIPVRVGQVGYMYDKVSGQLFGNSGTGSFIIGNDVN